MGRSKSTISREVARNHGKQRYDADLAMVRARSCRRLASRRPKKMTAEAIELVTQKLALQWSPEQISGWLERHHPKRSVSHETIYSYVWKDKRLGGELFRHLRHSGKKYNKRSSGKAGRGCIPNRVGIEQRPAIVEEKSRLGDWEIDTVVGKQGQGSAIVTMVDRASKYTLLAKIDCRRAECVEEALLRKLQPIKDSVHTITSDNGKEFSTHSKVSQALDAQFYFANPYHSWERGLNEHTNGLVRQYLPKGLSLDSVTQSELDGIEILLNNRPRKSLSFSTPIEMLIELRSQAQSVALHN